MICFIIFQHCFYLKNSFPHFHCHPFPLPLPLFRHYSLPLPLLRKHPLPVLPLPLLLEQNVGMYNVNQQYGIFSVVNLGTGFIGVVGS